MSNKKSSSQPNTRRFVISALVAVAVAGTGLLGTTAASADGPRTPPKPGQTQVIHDGALTDSEYSLMGSTPRGLRASTYGRDSFVDAPGGVLLASGNVVVVTGEEDNLRSGGASRRPGGAAGSGHTSDIGDQAAYPSWAR